MAHDVFGDVSSLYQPIELPRLSADFVRTPDPPAQWAYERIAKQIKAFEDELKEDEEVGLRLVATPDTSVMHIEDIGYWGPDMLIYYGSSPDRKPMQLLQHYTQMSILLTAVAKSTEKANRIGFHLVEKIEARDPD